MIKVVCWNIGWSYRPLDELLAMDDVDVALLQETSAGMPDYLASKGGSVEVSPQVPWEPWPYEHYDRWPLVVKLSNRVSVEWFKQVLPSIPCEGDDEIAVSNDGILAAAKVIPIGDDGEPFIAVSMYARWFEPRPTDRARAWIQSDAAAHHIISDLTTFVPYYDANAPQHRILAAGDLNMDFDFGRGTAEFALRANTVMDRMSALGLAYMGPQHPNGRRADPTPEHLPEDTRNVVTYYPGETPETARLQLDHVFASRGFHESIRTHAMNDVDEWGSSDHCRILIEVGD